MALTSNVKRRSSIYDARIAGLYDLEQTIGRGHFAVVKLAKHVFTGEKVAVKVIDKTKLDPVSKTHLMQEVRCMKLVQHPNIVRLYEVIDTHSKLFLILELADYDMYDYIMKHSERGMEEGEAQRFFAQIVEAIEYCHRLHVVHRDLKPENVVFFEESKVVKLTDFGFSNLFTPGQQLETSCGSLAYSAPEILLGDAYDAPAVDVWSMGVILYMLVCGRLPFQEANDSETLTKILDCSFHLPENLSPECKRLIKRMLVRDPGSRATLREIGESPWVQMGSLHEADRLPLVSLERVSEEAHEHIVQQMVSGGISDDEHIHRALESDEYSYITATYYLLAERVLKKERRDEAQKLLDTDAKSDSQLEIASLALSPRVQEKSYGGLTIICTCADPSELCACVQCKTSHNGNQTGSSGQIQGLLSPVGKSAPATPWQSATPTSAASSRRGSWRQRICSIVKEESEEELDKYLRNSKTGSPVRRHTPPSTSPLIPLQQELQDLAARVALGKQTPDRTGSRSPSPAGSTGSAGGRTSPGVGRFKSSGGPSLRKLSSSPHLRGICEEGEEDGLAAASASERPRPLTYSAVRMIRPRQAIVSPDVIRRYERVYGSGSRSRRSTSCSSSEASDDDSDKRFGLIASRHCQRDGSDQDDDSEPPVGGSRPRPARFHIGPRVSSGPAKTEENRKQMGKSVNGGGGKQLDAWKLIGKLQNLVLAPIREIPAPFFVRRLRSAPSVAMWGSDIKRLNKPKSCEQLQTRPANEDEEAEAARSSDSDVSDDESEEVAERKGRRRRKLKRCRDSALLLKPDFHSPIRLRIRV